MFQKDCDFQAISFLSLLSFFTVNLEQYSLILWARINKREKIIAESKKSEKIEIWS